MAAARRVVAAFATDVEIRGVWERLKVAILQLGCNRLILEGDCYGSMDSERSTVFLLALFASRYFAVDQLFGLFYGSAHVQGS